MCNRYRLKYDVNVSGINVDSTILNVLDFMSG